MVSINKLPRERFSFFHFSFLGERTQAQALRGVTLTKTNCSGGDAHLACPLPSVKNGATTRQLEKKKEREDSRRKEVRPREKFPPMAMWRTRNCSPGRVPFAESPPRHYIHVSSLIIQSAIAF